MKLAKVIGLAIEMSSSVCWKYIIDFDSGRPIDSCIASECSAGTAKLELGLKSQMRLAALAAAASLNLRRPTGKQSVKIVPLAQRYMIAQTSPPTKAFLQERLSYRYSHVTRRVMPLTFKFQRLQNRDFSLPGIFVH